jgi:hypothetical protein
MEDFGMDRIVHGSRLGAGRPAKGAPLRAVPQGNSMVAGSRTGIERAAASAGSAREPVEM